MGKNRKAYGTIYLICKGFVRRVNHGKRHGFFPLRLFPGPSDGKGLSQDFKKLDIQTLPISFVFRTYYINYYYSYIRKGETNTVQKLVLLSYFTNTYCSSNVNPLYAARSGIDLAVVSLLPNGNLAHLTLNNNSCNESPPLEWKLFPNVDRLFDDIINYRGKLWGVDIDGGAFVMDDFRSLKMTQVVVSPIIFIEGKSYILHTKSSHLTPITSPFKCASNGNYIDNDSSSNGRKRLVESSDMLYMLFPYRNPDLNNEIKVFQLTLIKGGAYPYEWVEIKSIGSNKAFLVGSGFGFSMVVKPKLGLNGNCIYLSGMSFCRSELSNRDYPLFQEMISKSGPSTSVYMLMNKKFRTITL